MTFGNTSVDGPIRIFFFYFLSLRYSHTRDSKKLPTPTVRLLLLLYSLRITYSGAYRTFLTTRVQRYSGTAVLPCQCGSMAGGTEHVQGDDDGNIFLGGFGERRYVSFTCEMSSIQRGGAAQRIYMVKTVSDIKACSRPRPTQTSGWEWSVSPSSSPSPFSYPGGREYGAGQSPPSRGWGSSGACYSFSSMF